MPGSGYIVNRKREEIKSDQIKDHKDPIKAEVMQDFWTVILYYILF